MKTNAPIHILHLEDSLLDAELIGNKLKAAGLVCTITVADGEKQFISALSCSVYDIILCDYNLIDYDGITALKLAREMHPLTPVLLISGVLGEEEAVQSLKSGATDYLLKQRLERLPAAISRALAEAEEQRQRKQAEDHNRELASLLDKAHDAIYVRDLHQRITYWNQGAEQLYGWVPEEVLGKDADNVLHQQITPELQEIHEAVLQEGEWLGEFKHQTKNGKEVIVMTRRSLLRDEEGRPVSILNINTDVTEKKRLEEQVVRARRLQSIISLAEGVARDLKHAVGPILMASEMLKQRHPDDRDLVDIVGMNAIRSSDLVRQLMTFAKGVEGARLHVQPQHLLRQIAHTIGETFPQNIVLHTRFPDDAPPMIGDSKQLQQVLYNICVNARDAMPAGGSLSIEIEAVSIDAEYARSVTDAKPGNYVLWSITDTGTGIPPDVLERIFEPFSSRKTHGKATSLGLATIMGIVKSHGGFIQVYSSAGEGSTFAVYLPAGETGAGQSTSHDHDDSALLGNGESILVVDSNAERRQLLLSTLSALNYEVAATPDATEAIVQIIQMGDKRGEFRAIIADLHMPHMNGQAFSQVVKRMLPQAEIIASRGPVDETEATDFRALGIRSLPGKHLDKHDLGHVVKAIITRQRKGRNHTAPPVSSAGPTRPMDTSLSQR